MMQQLVAAAAPWQARYEDSKILPTLVIAVHLTALLVGGGLALAADRTTLRVGAGHGEDRARQLAELRAVHRPVLMALAVLFVSGLALTAADLTTYLESPIYWIKSGFVVLLLANGWVMTRTESVLRRPAEIDSTRTGSLWRRMRWNARVSIALWVTTLVLGTALVNNA